MIAALLLPLVAQAAHATPTVAQSATPRVADGGSVHLRVNQVGYLPDAPKAAVACATRDTLITGFIVIDARGRTVHRGWPRAGSSFGACAQAWRLDFTRVRASGSYRVVVGTDTSRPLRIAANAYAGTADLLLHYMWQQRSGYNPLFRQVVHTRDGIVVDDTTRIGEFVPVTGGWADASDYLQYVATSATATYMLLKAYRDHPSAFADRFDATGDSGHNGVADVLDEARHGLAWLLRMFPDSTRMYNQLGDDRDHSFLDLPPTDSSDYGWGKGKERPVYPCTGRPQGLFRTKNRSDGMASTAGKYAAAFALASELHRARDARFAAELRKRALEAYEIGRRHPGVCQTAPGRSPYFYEEDNWTDDMELAAAQLHALTREPRYLREAIEYAAREPVTPWMGADTARHYQWFPWHNNGHHETWRVARAADRRTMTDYYRRGIDAVARRADGNAFRVGVPFIWCSNNLMASFATQAAMYRRMTGDARWHEHEQAAVDWLFGVNPWGVSMVIGVPRKGTFARDPHSVVAKQLGVELTGGLLDGPVYSSIFRNLRGIALHQPDEYAAFNNGSVVFHDDFGDYSTNEPIMDGTANLAWILSAMAMPSRTSTSPATARPSGERAQGAGPARPAW